MDLSPPATAKAKPSLEGKEISDLTDADLSEIFKRLPPYERLIVSEVCRRWHELSLKAWLDVAEIDLSPIPGKYIAAIVRQCPNLRSASAYKKSFDPNELACLTRASQLCNVTLCDCMLLVESDPGVVNDGFARIFSGNLARASWSEIVLHDARLFDKVVLPGAPNALQTCSSPCSVIHRWAFSAASLPASLKRLQLTGLYARKGIVHRADLFLDALDRLQGLECLILHHSLDPLDVRQVAYEELIENTLSTTTEFFRKHSGLGNLRELVVGPVFDNSLRLRHLVASLPRLEVLFLSDVYGDVVSLAALITEHSALHILVLSGKFFLPFRCPPIPLPARKRFPHGVGSAPLPLLHVFVGKEASENIRFAESSSDAMVIHPLNQPMPEFLEREDIAPLFEGVWAAERIKETEKVGGILWRNYVCSDTANSVQFS